MSKPRIGVVLSGCGFLDGSEIQEAVLTLLAIDEARAEAVCFAPDVEFDEVDHLTKKPTGQRRNALRESARIARGNISDVAKARAEDLDALVFPRGYGAAKNLATMNSQGAIEKVHPEVERLIIEMHESHKPLGFICIAPAMAAKVLNKVGGAQLTIGNDAGTAAGIEALGSKHIKCDCNSVVIDSSKRIVSTPAYMLGPGVADVNAGISKLIREVVSLCAVPV